MSGELDARPDLVQQIKELRDKVYELDRRVSGDDLGLDLSDINDVRVDSLGDATISLSDGDALVYRASDKLWIPGTASGAAISDYYNTSPTGTNVANATLVDLQWPTLTIGPGILDFSTPTVPVTLYAGEHTINATVVLGAGELTGGNAGEKMLALLRITDGTTPFGAETTSTFVDSTATDDSYLSLSLTAVVAAGSTVEIMAFNLDTGLTVTVQVTQVTVTGPSS